MHKFFVHFCIFLTFFTLFVFFIFLSILRWLWIYIFCVFCIDCAHTILYVCLLMILHFFHFLAAGSQNLLASQILFNFVFFVFGCVRSRSTCMQHFGPLAWKLSELRWIMCFIGLYIFCLCTVKIYLHVNLGASILKMERFMLNFVFCTACAAVALVTNLPAELCTSRQLKNNEKSSIENKIYESLFHYIFLVFYAQACMTRLHLRIKIPANLGRMHR